MTAANEEQDETSKPKRRVGRPPRIDREKIILAARDLPPEKVTMQAVADILHVDPTALNYHVGGRAGFLRLVALDRARLTARAFVEQTPSVQWQAALRRFAHAMRASVASLGPLARYLELDPTSAVSYLAPLERILRLLTEAGLPLAEAVRVLFLVAHTSADAGKMDAYRRAEQVEAQEAAAPKTNAPKTGAPKPGAARTQRVQPIRNLRSPHALSQARIAQGSAAMQGRTVHGLNAVRGRTVLNQRSARSTGARRPISDELRNSRDSQPFLKMIQAATEEFPLLRSLGHGEVEGIAFGDPADANAQFAFEIDVLLQGVEARLAAHQQD